MSLSNYEMHCTWHIGREDLCMCFFFVYWTQAQIDGKVVKATFTLPPRQKVSSPPKPVSAAPKRDAPKSDNAAADAEKDGGPRRPRESMSNPYILVIYNCCSLCFMLC